MRSRRMGVDGAFGDVDVGVVLSEFGGVIT